MSRLLAIAGMPIDVADADDGRWLEDLASRWSGSAAPVTRDASGTWRADDVVGDVWLAGRRLSIGLPEAEAAACVASVWCGAFEAATRHGPPAIHAELPHTGPSLRGRLDVRNTVRLRSRGSSAVASVYRSRNLDNDITRALVAAERALTRQNGHDRWRTRRVAEIMPQLQEAVGARAPVPTLTALARIRYSPITRPFREVAELSVRIVAEDPVVTSTTTGRPQGLLLPAEEVRRLVVAAA